jgi:hypothetical protein
MAGSQIQSTGYVGVTTGAQALVSPRAGLLHIVAVSAQGGATATITVYDSAQTNGAPSGTILATIQTPTTFSDHIDYDGKKPFQNGLYYVISGSGALGEVAWE